LADGVCAGHKDPGLVAPAPLAKGGVLFCAKLPKGGCVGEVVGVVGAGHSPQGLDVLGL
jgi:hypothetical protein